MKTITLTLVLFCLAQILYSYENSSKTIVSADVNGLKISIDGRQELISIVQYLGGYFRLNNLELEYKKDVDAYFEKFRNHEAVKFVQTLTKQGFTYDAPAAAMLYFSEDFELDKEWTPYLLARIGGEKNAAEFARQLKNFAHETKFPFFMDQQKEFYSQLIQGFSGQLKDFSEIQTIEDFFGNKQNSYNIILSILNSGNYGPGVETANGLDIYSINSPVRSNNGRPVFGDLNSVRYLVWHEFGHSFVNPLTEKNQKLVDTYSGLQKPIKEAMANQAYGNWSTIVNEHIIRAVTCKLAELKFGAEAAKKLVQNELGRSFFYITPILSQLDVYVNNRNTYKNFETFYPILIEKAFSDAQQNNYAVERLKSLNETFGEIEYVIVSADEKDSKVQNKIVEYMAMLKDRFWKDKKLISDDEALNLDLSACSFMVYGTVQNNKILQKYKDHFPVKVSKNEIVADKIYQLTDGKVIFNLKNPLNPDKTMVVYTAQQADGIPGINNVFHGPTNYIIFKSREEVLKAGFLEKEAGKWVCK